MNTPEGYHKDCHIHRTPQAFRNVHHMKSDHSSSVIQKGQKWGTYLFFLKIYIDLYTSIMTFLVLFSDCCVWSFTNVTRRLQYPRWEKSWFIQCHEILVRTVVHPSPHHSTKCDIWLCLFLNRRSLHIVCRSLLAEISLPALISALSAICCSYVPP